MSSGDEDDDVFPQEDLDELSTDDEEEVPEWAKSKSFDENDDIRKKRVVEELGGEIKELERRHEHDMHVQREINRKYCDRLKRRSNLISEIRKAYLRDIVTLKHVLNEQLSKDERIEVVQTWKKMIPSIDIRQHLMLYGPKEASFDTIPCETCGGSVELVHHDSSEIEELSKALSHMDKNKDDLRLLIATRGAQLENIQKKMEEVQSVHKEEKTVLYKEMRNIKAKSEDVHKDNITLTNQLRVTREQLSEARDKAEQYDKVFTSLNETTALLNEANRNIKNMEDASVKSKENVANLSDQLAVFTEEKRLAESEIQKQADHIKSISNISAKHKSNSETLSKKVTKLEKLFDDSRKEVESLSANVQDLEMNLQQQNEEMSTEIESLEEMLDTAREECTTLNEELQLVRYNLTSKTAEKDHLQNSYNELHFAKEEAVDRLEAEVTSLKSKVKKAEDEMRIKTSNYDKMEKDLGMWKEKGEKYEEEAKEHAKLRKDYDKMKKDYDKMNEADRERRRHAREAKKQEEENEKKRLADLEARAKSKPTSKPGSPEERSKYKREPSQKKMRDKKRREETQKAFEKQSEEGIVEQRSYVPHKRQRGKCRSSPISTPNTSGQTLGSLEDDSMAGGSLNMSGLPPLPDGASPIMTRSKSPKINSPLIIASRSGSPSSSRDVFSREGLEYIPSEGGSVELSPVLYFLRDEPQQMVLYHLDEGEESSVENDDGQSGEIISQTESIRSNSVDFSISVDSSIANYDFGTHQTMSKRLQKACKKLINEKNLASEVGVTPDFATSVLKVLSDKYTPSEEDLVSSDDEIKKSSDHKDNDELNDLVAENMKIVPQSSDKQSLCSDINCEHRDADGELNDETAKIFGGVLKDVHYALQSKFTAKESQVALDILAPKLLEISCINAKAQIGLWKAMKSTKLQTDFICKLAATCEKMIPFLGSDPTTMNFDDLANLHAKIADYEYFDQFREKWMKAVQLDEYMMKKLSEKEWNEKLSLFVDLPSSSHFDYDEDREKSFDTALNSMLVMEFFTDKMSGGAESLLTSLFLDWASQKLNFIDGGGFGGGGGNEAEMARLYSEMNAVKTELDFLKEAHESLKKEKDELAEKIAVLEPDAMRCQSLVDRNGKLSNDLQSLHSDFVALTDQHNSLTSSNKKLEKEHKKLNELSAEQANEIKSTKGALARVQENLEKLEAVHEEVSKELFVANERERIRLHELIHSEMQTDPFIVDVGCQTEFIVPPMSLHHKMSTNVSRSSPASSKRSFYPIVTPGGPSKGFVASLNDDYETSTGTGMPEGDREFLDQGSATSNITMSIDDGTNNSSIVDGTEFLEERSVLTPIIMHHEGELLSNNPRPGSKSGSKRGFNESMKMLNKISAAKNGKLDVGLPRIHSGYSEISSEGGSQASGVPQPLSGKLSPIKYVKPLAGPTWGTSDTIRMHPRKHMSRSNSSRDISDMLEAHRRNQAPPYRKDVMQSR